MTNPILAYIINICSSYKAWGHAAVVATGSVMAEINVDCNRRRKILIEDVQR